MGTLLITGLHQIAADSLPSTRSPKPQKPAKTCHETPGSVAHQGPQPPPLSIAESPRICKWIRFKKTKSAFCAVHKPILFAFCNLVSAKKNYGKFLFRSSIFLKGQKNKLKLNNPLNPVAKAEEANGSLDQNSLSLLVKLPKFHKIGANLGPFDCKTRFLEIGMVNCEYWLFCRDPFFMVDYNPYIPG